MFEPKSKRYWQSPSRNMVQALDPVLLGFFVGNCLQNCGHINMHQDYAQL